MNDYAFVLELDNYMLKACFFLSIIDTGLKICLPLQANIESSRLKRRGY